ncbi:hypothetical protein P885DRAFT_64534 [Corynascus similis CBS 632.67]
MRLQSPFLACILPGKRLDFVWDSLNNAAKERVCRHSWSLIAQIRTIPKPPHLEDSSAATTMAARVGTRCSAAVHTLRRRSPATPPCASAFSTNGDVAPRNILVDKDGRILALLDWENAGWYPDYWEYANLMQLFWRQRLEGLDGAYTTGILGHHRHHKARRVLF